MVVLKAYDVDPCFVVMGILRLNSLNANSKYRHIATYVLERQRKHRAEDARSVLIVLLFYCLLYIVLTIYMLENDTCGLQVTLSIQTP